jgi:hypothetical protein
MKAVAQATEKLGGWSGIVRYLTDDLLSASPYQTSLAREEQEHYGGEEDEISF